jgi:hypothetical protein
MKQYRSSIPKAARERVVARCVKSRGKYKVECILNGIVVGVRTFHETGELEYECPLKNGMAHGIKYRSDTPGKLLSAEPYSKGLPHGKARQWSHSGTRIGTYVMKRGTGVDLWWAQHCGHALPYLSEARDLKDGKWHGFEWWLNEDQQSVWCERHFHNDQAHGIERSWNSQGRLRRGYPRYWVKGNRVTKPQYLRESAKDPTLPPVHESDNRPQRRFPPGVMNAGGVNATTHPWYSR